MHATLTPLEQQITLRITCEAQRQPSAIGVWVFGSRACEASTEDSVLDIAVEFAAAETQRLRDWLEHVRREAEEPVVDQWPGFVNLVGLYTDDPDPRLAQRVRAEDVAVWRRAPAIQI